MKYRWKRLKEKMWIEFTWMLPAKLVYWCGLRMAARATTGDYSHMVPDDVSIIDMLEVWEKEYEV